MVAAMEVKRAKTNQMANLLVIIVTLLALLAGWLYKNNIESQTRHVFIGQVSADVPQRWRFTEGVANWVFSVEEPFGNAAYTVRLNPGQDGGQSLSLAAALSEHNYEDQLTAYRTLDSGRTTMENGQEAYRLSYVFVDNAQADLPVVMQGVDYFVLADGAILSVSYTAAGDEFDDGLTQFNRFLNSVSVVSGGG